VWRGHISNAINQEYTLCNCHEKETILHRFWSYDFTQGLWRYSTALLNRLAKHPTSLWDTPDWSQSLFANSIPHRFATAGHLWTLLRGLTLWFAWITRNECVFNQKRWTISHASDLVWQGLVDYAQAAWTKTMQRIRKDPTASKKALKRFDTEWGYFDSICLRKGMTISWLKRNPVTGIG
jgi:hypothetical protein